LAETKRLGQLRGKGIGEFGCGDGQNRRHAANDCRRLDGRLTGSFNHAAVGITTID